MQALMNNPDCKNQDKYINDGKSMFDDRKLGLMVVKWKKTLLCELMLYWHKYVYM